MPASRLDEVWVYYSGTLIHVEIHLHGLRYISQSKPEFQSVFKLMLLRHNKAILFQGWWSGGAKLWSISSVIDFLLGLDFALRLILSVSYPSSSQSIEIARNDRNGANTVSGTDAIGDIGLPFRFITLNLWHFTKVFSSSLMIWFDSRFSTSSEQGNIFGT